MNTYFLNQLAHLPPQQEMVAAMGNQPCPGGCCPIGPELDVEHAHRILRYDVLHRFRGTPGAWDAELHVLQLHFDSNQSIKLFVFHGDEFIANFCNGQEFQVRVNQDWWKGTEYIFNNIPLEGEEYSSKEHTAYPNLRWHWG
jgi:hypothetical protein